MLQLLKFHLQGGKLSLRLLGACFSLAGFLLQCGEPCLVIRKLASHLLLILEVCLQDELDQVKKGTFPFERHEGLFSKKAWQTTTHLRGPSIKKKIGLGSKATDKTKASPYVQRR
jgi:hypothetical protein